MADITIRIVNEIPRVTVEVIIAEVVEDDSITCVVMLTRGGRTITDEFHAILKRETIEPNEAFEIHAPEERPDIRVVTDLFVMEHGFDAQEQCHTFLLTGFTN